MKLSDVCLLALATLASADNPIIQTVYTADPAPLVYDGRLYLMTSHDEDGATYFEMRDWRLFSTTDMVNWQHHGSPLSLETFPWADQNAWAPAVTERNGMFYAYVPLRDAGSGAMSIGIATSDSIAGPYTDAIGGPIISDGQIDPAVFIDDDDQAYMYWGNPDLFYVKLNEDMISYDGGINQVDLTVEGFGPREGDSDRATAYEEGPWLYKRDGLYYMIYAANCCSEDIRYATGPTAEGPWTYQGIIMPTEGASFTNHPAVVDYEGSSYFFYHNGALPGGSGYTRSVAVESFTFNADGTIPEMTMTNGPEQTKPLDPFVRQEAETIAWTGGVEVSTDYVTNIENGDYIKVGGVDFGSGAGTFTASVAPESGGNIEVRLGSETGTLAGTCAVGSGSGGEAWETVSCDVTVADMHDVFFIFTGGSGALFNFDWWQFE